MRGSDVGAWQSAVVGAPSGRWDRAPFQAAMARSANSSYGLLHHEYYLARWEVRQGLPEPPFAELQP